MAVTRRILRSIPALALTAAIGFAQTGPDDPPQLPVEHAECIFFSSARGQTQKPQSADPNPAIALSQLTAQVVAVLPPVPGDSRTNQLQQGASTNTIDRYIFAALQQANVQPAPATNDYEFIRRVTLDLTGRIPTPDAVTAFVNDPSPIKRAKLVDSLMSTSQWVDKWTMFFGDLYKNNSRNTQIARYQDGVVAFNSYIKSSLSANKPYDQMAREIIATSGTNSYDPAQGQINWIVGGVVTGGPQQDIWDQQTANMAETFLGVSHLNCLLCHSGRGHLDALSLWGSQQTRQQAWGMAAFLSHTATRNYRVNPATVTPQYWSVDDSLKTNYPLNTTTGNRPARQPAPGGSATVSPAYIFTGETPKPGENYRAAFGRIMTSDFQFSRATVNYLWEYFFGVGLVSPSNAFDPARLDPNNPPSNCPGTTPCTLQPTNAALLNALAQDFIASKYDLKALMREITNSNTYQLSSRYNGTWNVQWATLNARHNVRRLWSEEVHDAITQSSNIVPSYNMGSVYGTVNWAMQLPETFGTPDGAAGQIATFLDAFLRGNRDDQSRRQDGSITQALGLENDSFVMNRILSTGPSTSLLPKLLSLPDDQLVNSLFLTVLSRYPTQAEMTAALANLKTNRSQEAENLLWSLYNKVDFVFNY